VLWTRGLLWLPAADLAAHELSILGSRRRSFKQRYGEEARISLKQAEAVIVPRRPRALRDEPAER
jgi:hypothetical protein